MVWDIGGAYEKTREMLVERLNDPFDIEVVCVEGFSYGDACYFCGEGIPKGKKMIRIVRYYDKGERAYSVDGDCVDEVLGY
ncbi:hypothetical protein HN903_02940 [archaeon]|jgi:hypothetical protein|nr:hypothetical protein [archaeon]MBT7128688.1 hypothetical protein [archaeon]